MSVTSPGGGISGKGGSFWTAAIGASTASTKVEGEIAEWRWVDQVDLIEATNFKSRYSGDDTQAVVDRIDGVASMTLNIKGFVSDLYTAMDPGAYLQVLLGVTGGSTPSVSHGPYVFRVLNYNYGNSVNGAVEFEANLESDSSRAVTA